MPPAARCDASRAANGPVGSRGVANLTHVTLQDSNDSCPASIYRRFVRNPAGLGTLNASCARRVTPIHTVGSYPRRLAQAVAATPRRGNQVPTRGLRAASVGLDAVGDETSRFPLLSGRRYTRVIER
jgi:hypothetical protein